MAAEAAARLKTVRDWLALTVGRFNEAGLYFGYLGMIREVLARTKAEMGGKAKVAATGGLAPLFLKDLPGVRHEPDLTLSGLRIAAGIISK